MNVIDIGIILLLIMFFISGFKNGVIKEAVSIVGLVVVFFLSYKFKGFIGSILCALLPFFKFSGVIEGMTAINIFFYEAIGFLITFAFLWGIYEIVMGFSKFLQKLVNLTIILLIPSKILGGILSVIKGYLIMFIIFLILLIPFKNQSIFVESKMLDVMMSKTPFVSSMTSDFQTAVSEVYDLGLQVSKKNLAVNDANLKTVDILLKYDIISKSSLQRLIDLHKLDDIENIDSVVSKY